MFGDFCLELLPQFLQRCLQQSHNESVHVCLINSLVLYFHFVASYVHDCSQGCNFPNHSCFKRLLLLMPKRGKCVCASPKENRNVWVEFWNLSGNNGSVQPHQGLHAWYSYGDYKPNANAQSRNVSTLCVDFKGSGFGSCKSTLSGKEAV